MLKIDKNLDMNSAIMEPLDSLTFFKEEASQPDVVSEAEFRSINFTANNYEVMDHSTDRSFLLMDAEECLHVATGELFCKKLKCSDSAKIKVVSIFGNTGDGKSHTMNHAFFKGEEVFRTSSDQSSCTLGVYAAMQPQFGVLCLDTEGLLSTSSKSTRRTRMLLKILAISDVVIYRTRSERLHSDMYEFLGTASKAFCLHFSQALQSINQQHSANLGPAVVIFHETRHTFPLQNSVDCSAEEKLRDSFSRLNYDIKAFSSLRYVGTQTSANGSTDYGKFLEALRTDLQNTTVRSPRQPTVIFKAMKSLNKKFSGEIVELSINPFPEQYFTCPTYCASCNRRCQRSMGHDGEGHLNQEPCQHQHQFENRVDLCKSCYNNGREVVVQRSEGWIYTAVNCPHCGEIANLSKLSWNSTQGCDAVRSQTVHIWKDSNITAKGPSHSGQMVLDRVSYVCEALSNISAQPTVVLKEWCADKVAPKYWKPNHEIINCFCCQKNFERTGLRKHHCRGCGEGFCDGCSQHRMKVPARGWLDEYVRVCNDCRQHLVRNPDVIPGLTTDNMNSQQPQEETQVTVRKYGETLYNTVTKVTSAALECTKDIIKDTARPDYWVRDSEATSCNICKMRFGTAEEIAAALASSNTAQSPHKTFKGGDCKRHHCRKCGNGVCADCSKNRRPVPERGWLDDVRVCDECANDCGPSLNTNSASQLPSTNHTKFNSLTDDGKSKVE